MRQSSVLLIIIVGTEYALFHPNRMKSPPSTAQTYTSQEFISRGSVDRLSDPSSIESRDKRRLQSMVQDLIVHAVKS